MSIWTGLLEEVGGVGGVGGGDSGVGCFCAVLKNASLSKLVVNAYCRSVGSISTSCFGCENGRLSSVRLYSILGR